MERLHFFHIFPNVYSFPPLWSDKIKAAIFKISLIINFFCLPANCCTYDGQATGRGKICKNAKFQIWPLKSTEIELNPSSHFNASQAIISTESLFCWHWVGEGKLTNRIWIWLTSSHHMKSPLKTVHWSLWPVLQTFLHPHHFLLHT